MLKVYVNPDDIWNYFQEHKKYLEIAMDNIAEVLNTKTEKSLVRIYLTEENGYPSVTIERVLSNDDEEVIAKECAMSADDCSDIYNKFLNKLKEYDQLAADRETELTEALANFLNILMGLDDSDEIIYGYEELLEMLDDIETMIYQDYGYAPYHPKIIDCDGQIKLVEFPYVEEDPYV